MAGFVSDSVVARPSHAKPAERRARLRMAAARTRPGRVRAGVAAVVVLACGLGVLIAVLFGGLNGGFRSIGHRDAPEVDAATGLYFSLNDMDAQVANVLLVGGARSLAARIAPGRGRK